MTVAEEQVESLPHTDSTCDYCGKLNGPIKYATLGSGINFLCADCIALHTCGNCERLALDIRPIDFGRSGVWRVCATCVESWT